MKFCPSCGEKLIDNAKFCKSCGAKMEGQTPNQTAHFTPDEIEFPKRDYRIAVIAGYVCSILLPVIGIIIAIYLFTRDDRPRHAKYILLLSIVILLIGFIRNIFYW